MKLYHGTNEDNGYNIYKTGNINANFDNYDTATNYIDELFVRYTGKNIRDGAIYFWDDIVDTDGSECVIKVNLDDLDLSKLYVGDYCSVNELYHHRDINEFCNDMSEEEFKNISLEYINTYINSFIPYTEYKKIESEYKSKYSPEFLYFGDAKIILEEDYLEYFEMI